MGTILPTALTGWIRAIQKPKTCPFHLKYGHKINIYYIYIFINFERLALMSAVSFGRLFLNILASLCWLGIAHAQSQAPASAPLSLDQMAPQAPQFTAALNVACGDLKKVSCSLVLPHIGKYAAKQGLTLVPVPSLGSVQSAQEDVCPGKVPMAIGMADGFNEVRHMPACATSFELIGHPLFPYFGYLVVANSVPVSTLDDLLNNTLLPDQTFSVSIGAAGTGGQVTFANILATNPTYRRLITTRQLARDAALDAILNHSLGGYFVMDGPDSPAIAAIATATDTHGNPLFKFLSINPGPAFYTLKDIDGQPLYHQVQINAGFMGFGSTTTLSTNAVIIVNRAWRHDAMNAQTLKILSFAADQADASIRAATHTPAVWNGDNVSGSAPSFVVLSQAAPSPQQLIVQLKPADIAPPAPPAGPTTATTAATAKQAAATPQILASTNLDIDFALSSAILRRDDMAALDNLGAALTNPQLAGDRFKIVGHTDTVGDPAANLALSLARAQTVQTYLEAKYGLPASRLQVEGVGEEDLLVNTKPQTPNQSNRRVEIINLGPSR